MSKNPSLPEAPLGPTPPSERGMKGAVHVGKTVHGLLSSLFSQEKFFYTTLALDWSMVVGAEIGAQTYPLRLITQDKGGIIYVGLTSTNALFSLYKGQEILERVNQYFGYKAVSQVIFRQGRQGTKLNLPTRSSGVTRPTPTDGPGGGDVVKKPCVALPENMVTSLQQVPHPGVRQSLESLAQALYGQGLS